MRSTLVHEAITERIIGAAIAVHRTLGPGLLEAVYEECLAYEFAAAGIQFKRQTTFPLIYHGCQISKAFRVDFLVAGKIVLELKAIDKLTPLDSAQLLTYVRLSDAEVGLLLNFNVSVLRDGIRRVVNKEGSSSPRLRVSAPPTTL